VMQSNFVHFSAQEETARFSCGTQSTYYQQLFCFISR
jgi:hypothetical protein